MTPVEALFMAAMKAGEPICPEWPEPADPREEWRCGTCAYWRNTGPHWEKMEFGETVAAGDCRNDAVGKRAWSSYWQGDPDMIMTTEDFGCRFWSAKPLEDKGADIPIACHNEG